MNHYLGLGGALALSREQNEVEDPISRRLWGWTASLSDESIRESVCLSVSLNKCMLSCQFWPSQRILQVEISAVYAGKTQSI